MINDLKSIFNKNQNLDGKSLESLVNALSRNNLPGFDYLEYIQSLGRMADLGMMEEVAFKSTFATATTVGLTKEKLVSSAHHYKEVLAQEKSQFDIALKNQLDKRVKSKRAEVEKLRNQILAWQKQIENLQKQIAKSQATIDSADQNIKGEMDKIEATKQSFEMTHQTILKQIDQDIANIQKYI